MRQHSASEQPSSAASRVVVGAIIVLALYWGRVVLMPIALAVLLTFLLNPIARRLQGLGMSRLVAVILAVVLAGAALTAVGVTGSRQVTGMLSNLPENTAKIVAKVKSLKALASGPTAQRFEQMVEAVSRELRPPVHSPTGEQEDSVETQVDRVILASETFSWATLTGHLGSAMEGLAMLAFAAVLLVFFLMDREGLRDRIVLLAGRSRLTVTSKALEDATNRVSRYIGMVAVVNGGFGLLLCIGLYLMGVPYAVLWGCLAAGLRFLPYLGPWIGAVFPIAMSLALSDGWWQPLAVFTYIMILELVTNNVVEPLAFGHTTGVAPAALLISAAFWLFIWGPVGLILSAPFAVSLVVIGKNIPQLRFLYVLLGDQPALRDDASFYQRLLAQDHTEIRTSIANHVHDSSVESLFDNLIVPAIVYTKQDVRREHLSDEEGAAVLQVLRESVLATDLPRTPDGASSRDDDNRRLTLLACPIDGEPDRFALSLLGIVTDADHWNVQVVADGILMSEIVSQLASDPPAAVCITSIKPDGIVHARSWCKKIRAAAPNIPLIVCRLGQQRHLSHSARTRLMEVGATTVTCSLQETRRWLSARYPVLHDDATRPDLKSPINRGHAEPAISRSA